MVRKESKMGQKRGQKNGQKTVKNATGKKAQNRPKIGKSVFWPETRQGTLGAGFMGRFSHGYAVKMTSPPRNSRFSTLFGPPNPQDSP